MPERREGLIGEAIRSAKQARKLTLGYVRDLMPEALVWRPIANTTARPKPSESSESRGGQTSGNPILWILWHIGEVEESVLWTLEGKAPSFRFGRSALKARGQDVALPPRDEVLPYLADVRGRYLARLEAFTDADLDRVFGEGVWRGTGRGLIALPPRHEAHHCGQIAYIRRLMGQPAADVNERNPYQ